MRQSRVCENEKQTMIFRNGVLVKQDGMLAVVNFLILILLILFHLPLLVHDCFVLQVDVEHYQIFVLLQDISVAIA